MYNNSIKTNCTIIHSALYILIGLASINGCGKNDSAAQRDKFMEEIRMWQENRTRQIGREDGWLSLAGLFWLKEGKNSLGTGPSNDIILPEGSTSMKAGFIMLENGNLSIITEKGVSFQHKDSLITRMKLTSDQSGKADPTVLTSGSVSFYVIKRGDRFGVRVKDKMNAPLKSYKSLDFYPPDPVWKIEGIYKPHPVPKLIEIASIIGTIEQDTFPGMIIFRTEGRACSLDVTTNSRTKELYLMFTDETTGRETYGNGRQLTIPPPDQDGKVFIDFNKSANWPCAYTPYGTCPIPPKQNHVPARIEAGEKKYPGAEDNI